MRVLIAPDAVRDGIALAAGDVASTLAEGWSAARSADVISTHPLSAGGRGLLDVLQASLGGEQEIAMARDATGEAVPCAWLRVGSTAYLETASLLGDPRGEQAAPLAVEGTSAGVGDLLLAAITAGARRVVVGVDEAAAHDVGLGTLQALVQGTPADPVADVVTRAAEVLRGTAVVVAAATDVPLVGLSGAGAALGERPGIDAAAAQARELAVAKTVATIESAARAPRSLLAGGEGRSARAARRPHAGAGGGVAFALGCVGAQVLPGAEVVAVETVLRSSIEAADLVVSATTVLDGDAVSIGVPGAVGRVALEALVPAVALAASVLVGRRELAGTGLEAVYPLSDPPAPGRAAPVPSLATALSQRASRVARTWSR